MGIRMAVVLLAGGVLGSCAAGGYARGGVDLLADGDLSKWTRVPLGEKKELSARNPWSWSADRKVVVCDGVGILEALMHPGEFGDGVFHVEWRFLKDSRGEYNSGIYFHSSRDLSLWHQAQVAIKKERPVVGDLFGGRPGSTERIDRLSALPPQWKPIGEWNAVDIDCRDGSFTLSVNGTETASWPGTGVKKGAFALQSEFYRIEFRNVRFHPR